LIQCYHGAVIDGERPPLGRPGRKRSEGSRLAILKAALELAGEVGYTGVTVEGIAARAGTGKQTIYRWWPSKADVVLEALATKADLFVSVADQGTYATDLRAFLTTSFALGRRPEITSTLRVLMAQAQIEPGFRERIMPFLEGRREALAVIVDRARRRGDLPPHPAPDTIADIVFGVIWYRMLATTRPMDDALADDLVTTLAPAAAGSGP
jgi:AcrR family transcriptional regulator